MILPFPATATSYPSNPLYPVYLSTPLPRPTSPHSRRAITCLGGYRAAWRGCRAETGADTPLLRWPSAAGRRTELLSAALLSVCQLVSRTRAADGPAVPLGLSAGQSRTRAGDGPAVEAPVSGSAPLRPAVTVLPGDGCCNRVRVARVPGLRRPGAVPATSPPVNSCRSAPVEYVSPGLSGWHSCIAANHEPRPLVTG